jgi:hypothetical protein
MHRRTNAKIFQNEISPVSLPVTLPSRVHKARLEMSAILSLSRMRKYFRNVSSNRIRKDKKMSIS